LLSKPIMSESNWEKTGRALQEIALRCRELGAAPDPAWQTMPVADLALAMQMAEALVRPACDELMRALSRPGGVVGKLTPQQAYFCSMRCLCALDTLGLLHADLRGKELYPVPPPWPARDLLEWLLVSNWAHRHDTWLKLAAYAGATGRGLYSG
jgi:hypothetical protein